MSYQPQPVYVTQTYQCSTAHVVIAWVLAVLTGFYLLPWAIAATRNRTNVAAVALVNALTGWTVVGWIVALVMACGSNPVQQQFVTNNHLYAATPSPYPPQPLPPYGPPTYHHPPAPPASTDTRPIELGESYPLYGDRYGYETTQPLPPPDPRHDGDPRPNPPQ